MKTIETRFGTIEYAPENLITFPSGLIGLPDLREFVVMPNKKKGPLFWIQSVDDTDIAFVLTDPRNFFLDYSAGEVGDSELASLEVDKDDEVFALSVVTVPPDQKITLNLAAPILFSPKSNRAIQIILENSKYATKTPLPVVEASEEQAEKK